MMDHVGNMADYIQQGLKLLGYSGVLDPEQNVDYDSETGILTMKWVWGKDASFRITIEDEPEDGISDQIDLATHPGKVQLG